MSLRLSFPLKAVIEDTASPSDIVFRRQLVVDDFLGVILKAFGKLHSWAVLVEIFLNHCFKGTFRPSQFATAKVVAFVFLQHRSIARTYQSLCPGQVFGIRLFAPRQFPFDLFRIDRHSFVEPFEIRRWYVGVFNRQSLVLSKNEFQFAPYLGCGWTDEVGTRPGPQDVAGHDSGDTIITQRGSGDPR